MLWIRNERVCHEGAELKEVEEEMDDGDEVEPVL